MSEQTSMAPVEHEVLVPCDVHTAHQLFTAHIGSWWPLGGHGVFGPMSSVAFEGDAVIERLGARFSQWAEVLVHDPPRSLKVSWHPGTDVEQATTFRVTFRADGGNTRVRLVHRSWDQITDGAARRAQYEPGWRFVLSRYEAFCGR